jgi:hypothetical protein
MSLYASYVCLCILTSLRIPPINLWVMDPSFLRWFCHNKLHRVCSPWLPLDNQIVRGTKVDEGDQCDHQNADLDVEKPNILSSP